MKLRSDRVLQRGKLGIENEDLTSMKLRSNRVLKRAKLDIESQVFSDNLSNGENRAIEGEIEVFADDADENVKMGTNDGVNVNVDDRGVLLGSKVFDPLKDSAVSCSKQETEENEAGHVDCESGSEHLDSGTGDKMVDDVGDDIKQTLLSDTENANLLGKGRRERRKKNAGNVKNGFNQDKIDGELKKGKVEKDADHVSMRVLRSRTMTTISDGTMAVDGGLRETVSGSKRLDESIQLAGIDGYTMAVDGGLREILGLKRLHESIQLAGNGGHERKSTCHVRLPILYVDENPRPKKKLKSRGGPPKFPIERCGRPRKIISQDVQLGPTELRARRQHKQLLKKKITDMLLKSGWTIEYRKRRKDIYMDVIYVEPNRKRVHWSINRAYARLKNKIKEGDADDSEISAYYRIPEKEISMLFRHSKKKSGDEKKKNRMQKKVTKGEIVTNKKKDVFKKSKNGSIGKLSKKIKERSKPRLLVCGLEKGSQKDNNVGLVTKNQNLLQFMIDSGVILVGSKVQYGKTKREKKSYEGTITSYGICCCCCNEVMGISKFVSHCGGKTSQGFDNVYLESGMCLRKCLVDSWRRKAELNSVKFDVGVDVKGDDPNDDVCNICGAGGDLICCDSCPSTFHQSCLDIQNIPSGDWNCNYCCCKFCGVLSVTIPQVDDSNDAAASEMLQCCSCEDKFHLSCLSDVIDVNIESNGRSFCGRKCQELFKQLQTYLGVKHELEDGFSWTLLQRSDIDQDLTVHDAQLKVEHNSKLAVAFSVMDECFLPINDNRSGTNIIHSVVNSCSSNFKRLNYSGFVTAVLEKGDELITVASIRVHGYRLAEMPFIGTREMYRRQGMCRRLLVAIESCLTSIGVEELIIPSTPELLQTWTKVFGFMPLEESLKQAMKCMSMIVFPGTDMLKKPLLQNRAVNANPSPSAASDENVVECNKKQNDENLTLLEIISSKERAWKDVIYREQTREDVIDNEQSEEPRVKKNVIESTENNKKPVDAAEDVNGVCDYKHSEEVLMDRCSCPTNKKKSVFKKTKNGSKKKLGKKIKKRSKPRFLVHGPEKESQRDNNVGLVTKNRNLLQFMIDSGVISVGSKVQYGKTEREKKSYEGTITSYGICCGCCNEVMGISEFVSHCGGKTSQGFDNVYLESGMCLRKCLVDSWRRKAELNSVKFDVGVDVKGDDPNDDVCNICGAGGDLICCDSCPSTFHQSCLDIQNIPPGDWNCNYCCCKFCGVLSVTIPQVDNSHDAAASEMLQCCLCDDKFHLSCLSDAVDVNIESSRLSFCGRKCQELFKQLQTYLGVKHELEDGFSWTLLQRSDIDQDLTVHDAQLKVEQNSKLAVAFSVMDECFLPINDNRSGTNIIHSVVYNCSSNFKRLNYSGFVTAVLEKGDELITVASIRVHGYRLAEMPFIGTREMYRRQGMCRRLLVAIESCLSSIGVEELIIPVTPELLQTSTKVFGFIPLEESLKQAMNGMSMIVFPGIEMRTKPLLQNRAVNANCSPSTECNSKQNDENLTLLEIISSKERAGKDAIDREQTREDVIDNEQSEEPTVKKNVTNSTENNKKPVDAAEDVNRVSDYKQTEELLMNRCSCPSIIKDKLITRESPEGVCDLNFPVNNGGPGDTDDQVDSFYFQDGTNQPNSMDFMTSEVKIKPSQLTSELIPQNTFYLNLQQTGVEIDIDMLRMTLANVGGSSSWDPSVTSDCRCR